MERLRLLVSMVSASGIKGRSARKVVIALSASKFMINNNDVFKELKWYQITQSKESFKAGIEKLNRLTKLEIFDSNDLISFIEKVEESEFQKIITAFDGVDDNVKKIELVRVYRSMATMERESGEYLTNDNILDIAVRVVDIRENTRVIDSFNGESGVLTAIYSEFAKEGKDFSKIKFYGQEINKDSYEIGQLIAYMLAGDKFILSLEDSIKSPAYLDCNNLMKFDYAISVPPFGLVGDNEYVDKYGRFRYFKDKKVSYTNSSWLLAEHILATINETGKAAILLPIGALFRSSISDKTVKKALVNEDLIECIIKLPAGVLNYTGGQTCWVIINKNKCNSRKNKIQFIDLSEKVETVGRREKIIPNEFIDIAINEYREMRDSDLSFIIDRETIDKNEYNLDAFEYIKQQKLMEKIDTNSAIKLADVATIRRGIQLSKSRLDVLNKEEEKSHYILGLGNIVDGKIVLNEEDKIAVEDRWVALYEVKEGDILLTSKGSLLKIAIVDSTVKKAILSANLFVIRVNQKKYNEEVLKYYLESEIGQQLLGTIMKGAVIKSISNKDLEGLIIPNIDIDKQKDLSEKIKNARIEYENAILLAKENYREKKEKIKLIIKL